MNELNGKEDLFDAVILECQGKDATVPRLQILIGLKNSRDRIDRIGIKKFIYHFSFFTGQPDYANQ